MGEYCTWDVAESAIAYMGALNKHFKFYQREIDERHKWDYAAAPSGRVWRIRCWASLGSARSANARPRRRWAS